MRDRQGPVFWLVAIVGVMSLVMLVAELSAQNLAGGNSLPGMVSLEGMTVHDIGPLPTVVPYVSIQPGT